MAAQIARPGKKVLILHGDGAFGLNGMEFESMVRQQLPIVSIIGNDGAWGKSSIRKRRFLVMPRQQNSHQVFATTKWSRHLEDMVNLLRNRKYSPST